MGFYYDVSRAETSNSSAGTASPHVWAVTAANQETLYVMGVFAASRYGTAGGAQLRTYFNTGTIASGGTAYTPNKKNSSNPAAASTWASDASTITAGTTLVLRNSVGFAQTGGMGGYVPPVGVGALQMRANGANPIDAEWDSLATSASVTFDLTIDFCEGSPT